LDLPAEILPEITPTGSLLGELRPEIARETGAPGLTVIAPAAHDTGSAVAAIPVSPTCGPGSWAYISSGTWSLMGIEVREPLINDLALERNFTNEGGAGGTYRFLKNIAGLWLIQECRRIWSIEDGSEVSYSALGREALAATPFSSLIDPDHPSFLRPGHMPRAIADYCRCTGQSPPGSRGRMIRTILESLALTYRRTRDALEEISGNQIEVLHVVGGGSQNELLNQFTADALALPVLAGPVEATALGNLALQAMAMKVVPGLAAARDLIRRSTSIKTYEPRDPARWDQAAGDFARIVERGRAAGDRSR
jgi:rhamnulokinase